MKSKPLTIIIITIVIVAAISLVIIWPVVSNVLSSYNDLNQTKASLKTLEEKRVALEQLKQNPNLNEISDIALKYIPKEATSGDLVIELTAIAGKNNLKVDSISLESKKSSTTSSATSEDTSTTKKTSPSPVASSSPAPTFQTVNFSMKLVGTFANFIAFLQGTETSSRLITIDNLALQQAKTAGTTDPAASFTAELSGSAHYKPDISIEDNLDNLKLSDKVVQQFLKLKTYGTPINLPAESGFGRSNPFEGY